MKLIAWIYRPTPEDEALLRQWSSSTPQAMPELFAIRFRNQNDTPMDDVRYFPPGWKRAEWLDEK